MATPPVGDPKRHIARSKVGKIRAGVLIAVQAAIAIHIGLWLASGKGPTLSPVEPSESMYTLEDGAINAGFIFFGLAILSTAIFGRWFCGWGCHIVALQDLCGWAMKKCGVKPRPFRSRLLVIAPLMLALYMFAWPSFKRIVIHDWVCESWNWVSWDAVRPYVGEAGGKPIWKPALVRSDFWRTFPPWYEAIPFLAVCGFGAVYFLGAKGYCTYGCPYGGFFTPIDKISPARIRVTDACEHCGHCTAVCTSNVRVHEEVRDYGMVIDPGCMKCLDCVSVCPNDALYFGLGRPAILAPTRSPEAPKHKKFKRRVYDLSWPQEILAALLMLVLFFAYRGMGQMVSALMAIAMAGIGTLAFWKLWQIAREPSVRLQSLQLKLKGALRPAGVAFVAVGALYLALGAWGLVINYHANAAAVLDDRVRTPQNVVFAPGYTPAPADRDLADRAYAQFVKAGPPSEGGIGWSRPQGDYIRMAWLAAVAGRWADAETNLLRGIRADAAHNGHASTEMVNALSTVMDRRGAKPDEVLAAYRTLVRDFPRVVEPRLALAHVELAMSLPADAGNDAMAAIAVRPTDPDVVVPGANVLLNAGRTSDADGALRSAIKSNPNDAHLAAMLGVALAVQNRPEEAARQLEHAVELNPQDPQPMAQLAQLYAAMGNAAESAKWQQRAAKAASGVR